MLMVKDKSSIMTKPIDASVLCPKRGADPGGFYWALTATLPAVEIVGVKSGEYSQELRGINGLRYALADVRMDTIEKLETLSHQLKSEGVQLLLFNNDDQSEENRLSDVPTFCTKEDAVNACLEDWEKVILPRFGW